MGAFLDVRTRVRPPGGGLRGATSGEKVTVMVTAMTGTTVTFMVTAMTGTTVTFIVGTLTRTRIEDTRRRPSSSID